MALKPFGPYLCMRLMCELETPRSCVRGIVEKAVCVSLKERINLQRAICSSAGVQQATLGAILSSPCSQIVVCQATPKLSCKHGAFNKARRTGLRMISTSTWARVAKLALREPPVCSLPTGGSVIIPFA